MFTTNHTVCTRSGVLGWLCAAIVVFFSGCGAQLSIPTATSTLAQSAPPPISVSISPGISNVDQGAQQQFAATVSNSTNISVNWSVQEPTGGIITPGGLYTAPNAAGTYHVIATSAADATKTSAATIVVPQVSISIEPASITLPVNTYSADVVAVVTGTVHDLVNWSVQEGSVGGNIGLDLSACIQCAIYGAPPASGTYHIVATSHADPKISATAIATVTPPVMHLLPGSEVLGPQGTREFAAWIEGMTDQNILWSIQEGTSGGTVDATGLYTAPTAQGAYHLVATSASDGSVTESIPIAVVAHGFKPVGKPVVARYPGATLTVLQDGRVLIAGGSDRTQHTLAAAEIFDPATNTFASTGAMTTSRAGHTATLLTDGSVLLVGGNNWDASSFTTLASAERYDPVTGTFLPVGGLAAARQGPTATLLVDGRVLIAGGDDGHGAALASAEVYDPAKSAFASVPNMSVPREGHTATLLSNNRVLLVGGDTSIQFPNLSPAQTSEEFDPATDTFSAGAPMTEAREEHTATLLSDGRVLIAGALNWTTDGLDVYYLGERSAEIYDSASDIFNATASMNIGRMSHFAILLVDGTVLLGGGTDENGNDSATAEVFDPVTEKFTLTGSMQAGVTGAPAVLLKDGRVLVLVGPQLPETYQ